LSRDSGKWVRAKIDMVTDICVHILIPICIQYHEDYPKIYHSKFDHDPLDKG
jgi:hypothetical protein